MPVLNFPANPASQTPPNVYSPTSSPASTSNSVTYIWDGVKWESAGAAVPTIDYTYPGGVQQTLQKRLEQYVSIQDFGAVGDGVRDPVSREVTGTDNTAAIQAAFDWWCAEPRRCLTFPEGVYIVTSRINACGNMTDNLTGNSLLGLGGQLYFKFATTGVEASRFGLVLDLMPSGKQMREMHISGLNITGNYDEYSFLIDAGTAVGSAMGFIYGTTIERLYLIQKGLCISGNAFEMTVSNCYITTTEGDGMDDSKPIPQVHGIFVTQGDVITGGGGTGSAGRKISSMAIDSNNIRGGINGIRIDDGASDVTLRNNTTLGAWQSGLVYNGTFSGCNILHHHIEKCYMQYPQSIWEDPNGVGFFDENGKRWSGTSGDASGAGTVADPIKGNWAEWYAGSNASARNTLLQRAGMRLISSRGGGNVLGTRQVQPSKGGVMSAIYIQPLTDKPSFISGTSVSAVGAEVVVGGPGAVVLNTDSYAIVNGWPQIIQLYGASSKPAIQGVIHNTGNNTGGSYTPFSSGSQNQLRGSVFVALKTGLTINAPQAFNGTNSGYDPVLGDELHFVLQQTSQNTAVVTWDSIYETNGFIAKTGNKALSSISFRYIKNNDGDYKWMIISSIPVTP